MINIALEEAARRLKAANIANPFKEARALMAHSLDCRVEWLIAFPERLTLDQAHFFKLIERRIEGEPLSRIKGMREFYGRSFKISPAVLDPRPESELIIDCTKSLSKNRPFKTILDIGTGSGILAISLLCEFPNSVAIGVDCARDALNITKENAQLHGVDQRLTLYEGEWVPPPTQAFDLIVSNPPYIKTQDIDGLSREVKAYDPHLALDGGEDGLDPYRAIASKLAVYCQPNSVILFEIGMGQQAAVISIMAEYGFNHEATHHDLANIPRVLHFSRITNTQRH